MSEELNQQLEKLYGYLAEVPLTDSGDYNPQALLDLYLRTPKNEGLSSFFLTLVGVEHDKNLGENELQEFLIDHLTSATHKPEDDLPIQRTVEQEERLRKALELKQLLQEQDVEYEESLRIDREKAEQKRLMEEEEHRNAEKRKREEEQERERLEALEREQSRPIDERRRLFAERFEKKFKTEIVQ